jgi:hypothetical protein
MQLDLTSAGAVAPSQVVPVRQTLFANEQNTFQGPGSPVLTWKHTHHKRQQIPKLSPQLLPKSGERAVSACIAATMPTFSSGDRAAWIGLDTERGGE